MKERFEKQFLMLKIIGIPEAKTEKSIKKTITDVLGENWGSIFNGKEGEEIMRELNWLIKKINNELGLEKQ